MNPLTHYFVPNWIAIAFLIAIPLPFILIASFVRTETQKTQQYKWAYPCSIIFFILYIGYIILASNKGWFNQVFFPPKVLLLTTFPFATFLFIVIVNSKVYKTILANAPLQSLVRLHSFRIIGVFFIILALHDALPKPFAIIAGLGDMLTAISSFFVANAIQQQKKYAKRLTFFWNLFGTIDILFTAVAANLLTKLSIDNGSMGVDTLAVFPFCIIPAFAPPVILFLHWSIFKKLNQFSN
jgi:uncharacterized membrane protein (DUF485 family)